MDLYSVIDEGVINRINLKDFVNLPINYLIQFRKNTYPFLKDFKKSRILVDSGAYYFNFMGRSNDKEETEKFLESYYEFIENTCEDSRIQGYFDMDLVYMGLPNIKRIRHKLFSLSEKIIPVYHTVWGLQEFKRMCKKYDYIALGCSNNIEIPVKDYGSFVKYAHRYGCRVHGLGMNNNKIMKEVPFDSCDSILWLHDGFKGYYLNHNIEKNKENNKKYRPLYERKALLKQYQRQEYFKNYWEEYTKLNFL